MTVKQQLCEYRSWQSPGLSPRYLQQLLEAYAIPPASQALSWQLPMVLVLFVWVELLAPCYFIPGP